MASDSKLEQVKAGLTGGNTFFQNPQSGPKLTFVDGLTAEKKAVLEQPKVKVGKPDNFCK